MKNALRDILPLAPLFGSVAALTVLTGILTLAAMADENNVKPSSGPVPGTPAYVVLHEHAMTVK